MRWYTIKNMARAIYKDAECNHTMAIAAGLSYYFLLSLFPLLIFLAALLAFVPVPHLFDAILDLMAKLVPPDAMGTVRAILLGVMNPPRSGLLSFGLLATLWAATGGSAAMIEALNIAYNVNETRAYWKTRLLAIGLTLVVGGLTLIGLCFTLLGPEFGFWMERHRFVGPAFSFAWPYLRWGIILVTVVLAIEVLYFYGPNVKQSFRCTAPGAFLGVTVWIAISFSLGGYIARFANYNATYGTLGGVIALMLWFYFSALAILIGAQLNAELLKAAGKVLPVKEILPPALPKAA